MKVYLVLVLSTIVLMSCQGPKAVQSKSTKEEEPAYRPSASFDHIAHIRKHSRIGALDGKPYEIEYFVDYVIQNYLEKPEYKKYITDRKLLRKLNNEICQDDYALIRDTLSNGDECSIEIKAREFIPEAHKIILYDNDFNWIKRIDGKVPFGGVYGMPTQELGTLVIEINGAEIDTQIHEYQNLYAANFCEFGGFRRAIEAYEDGDNIYVYIYGGNAAATYFAKLIFDRSGYVTSIIADYDALSDYGSFSERFIGF